MMSDRIQTMPFVRDPLALVADVPERVHMLGVGGAGLSGAARLLLAQGHRVTGHDRCESPFAHSLRSLGIEIELGDSARAGVPAETQLVVRSAAIPDTDPQVLEARQRGLPVWKYGPLLGRLAPERRTLAVAGTHGKTTSSWMLYHALAGVARLTGGALGRAVELLEGLEVRPERMRANLGLTNGLLMAEAVQMALAPALGRLAAHDRIEAACRKAVADGRALIDALAEDPVISGAASRDALAGLLDPAHYLGAAGEFVDRVLVRYAGM